MRYLHYLHYLHYLDARHEAALDQVFELTVLLAEDMNASFERDGLTPARAHLLWVLQERCPSTQQALADALRVSPRNVTGLVDGLEESGLVVRRHPTDRRATLVAFTPGGTASPRGWRVTRRCWQRGCSAP